MLGPSQRQELLHLIRRCNKVGAVILLRRELGLGLKEALDELESFQAGLEPHELYAEDHMGMSANVLAIGKFRRDIVDYMEYPPKFYSDTRDGAPIVRFLFHIDQGSTRSRELASCFGIEPWDFNQHRLDPHAADLERLRAMFDEEEVGVFAALRDAGFEFIFMPNG